VLVYRDARSIPASADDWAPGTKSKRGFPPGASLRDLPAGATVATSSTRRLAQVRHLRPDLEVVPIRGNVGTRLQKVAENPSIDATLLAAAGLARLHFHVRPDGPLVVDPRLSQSERDSMPSRPPAHLLATILDSDEMLPAVGQGALGLEIRTDDAEAAEVCAGLNHSNSFQAVAAERELLFALGGGCQSPVAAHARVLGHELHLRAASFRDGVVRTGEGRRPVRQARELGHEVAESLR
jgi:hydroxymethylbilane synthase